MPGKMDIPFNSLHVQVSFFKRHNKWIVTGGQVCWITSERKPPSMSNQDSVGTPFPEGGVVWTIPYSSHWPTSKCQLRDTTEDPPINNSPCPRLTEKNSQDLARSSGWIPSHIGSRPCHFRHFAVEGHNWSTNAPPSQLLTQVVGWRVTWSHPWRDVCVEIGHFWDW